MRIEYDNKKSEIEILRDSPCADLIESSNAISDNLLIFGDNLPSMKTLLECYEMKGKIGLVYIDPPFSTNGTFRAGTKRTSTISASVDDAIAYNDHILGDDFLEFIRERLIFIRELMSETASIYLHIDYKVGHYVKLIMDEVFGVHNFRNDITRIKCNPKNFDRTSYGNIKDMVLFYSKTDKATWNNKSNPLTDNDIFRLFKKIDSQGRRYTTIPLHAPGETKNGETGRSWKGILPPKGRHWRTNPKILDELDKEGLIEWSPNGVPRKIVYADDAIRSGKKVQDIWEYKDPQYPVYPTEKNYEMLKTIIQNSSEPGDIVLDCFCGSGSTLLAAQELGRRWIGIDKSQVAIESTKKRLEDSSDSLFSGKYRLLIQEENVNKIVALHMKVSQKKIPYGLKNVRKRLPVHSQKHRQLSRAAC